MEHITYVFGILSTCRRWLVDSEFFFVIQKKKNDLDDVIYHCSQLNRAHAQSRNCHLARSVRKKNDLLPCVHSSLKTKFYGLSLHHSDLWPSSAHFNRLLRVYKTERNALRTWEAEVELRGYNSQYGVHFVVEKEHRNGDDGKRALMMTDSYCDSGPFHLTGTHFLPSVVNIKRKSTNKIVSIKLWHLLFALHRPNRPVLNVTDQRSF